MKTPLSLVATKNGDPRVRQTLDLAAKFLDAFEASGCDRDILTSAVGLLLTHMYVCGGVDETFARFAVGGQLAEMVVANMPIVRAALEKQANEPQAT
jgi:hypothetical protein